jgi:hypothetical protein
LKAWIAVLGHEYPRTHDLALLCALVSDLGGVPSPFQQLMNFSPFGTRFRYDDIDRRAWIAPHGTSSALPCSPTWPR